MGPGGSNRAQSQGDEGRVHRTWIKRFLYSFNGSCSSRSTRSDVASTSEDMQAACAYSQSECLRKNPARRFQARAHDIIRLQLERTQNTGSTRRASWSQASATAPRTCHFAQDRWIMRIFVVELPFLWLLAASSLYVLLRLPCHCRLIHLLASICLTGRFVIYG